MPKQKIIRTSRLGLWNSNSNNLTYEQNEKAYAERQRILAEQEEKRRLELQQRESRALAEEQYNRQNRDAQNRQARQQSATQPYMTQAQRQNNNNSAKQNDGYFSRAISGIIESVDNATRRITGEDVKSISPEEFVKKTYVQQNSNPSLLTDAIAPLFGTPEYDAWAELKVAEANKKRQEDPLEAIRQQFAKDPELKAAENYVNYKNSDQYKYKQQEYKNKMSALQKSSKLAIHQTLGEANKKYRLSDEESLEMDRWLMSIDPNYARQRISDFHEEMQQIAKYDKQELLQLLSVEQPDDYYGQSGILGTLAKLGFAHGDIKFAAFSSVLGLVTSAWAHDAFSDYMGESNGALLKTSVGKIARADEYINMSDKVKRYVSLEQEYRDIVEAMLLGVSPQLNKEKLVRLAQIRQELEELNFGKVASDLASWSPSWMGMPAEVVDRMFDLENGGLRYNLYGLDDKIKQFKSLSANVPNDYNSKEYIDWKKQFDASVKDIKSQLYEFDQYAYGKQEKWRQDILVDLKDLQDWRTGDNWLGIKTKMSDYYRAQKQLLEKQQFDWRDPAKQVMFGWAGIAGGSNSSWAKTTVSGSSKILGSMAAAFLSGGTSALAQAVAIGTSYAADYNAGSDENNIEAGTKTSQLLQFELKSRGSYNDFIKEGIERLSKNEAFKSAIDSFDDRSKLEDFITDAYISGLWQSRDAKAVHAHANAVIGTNNLFYSDQPVNTLDAAVGSVASIADLTPVKYLTRSTKIGTKLLGRSISNRLSGTAAQRTINNLSTGIKQKTAEFAGFVGARPIAATNQAIHILSQAKAKSGEMLSPITTALGKYAKKPKVFVGAEERMTRQLDKARMFAARVPSIYLKGKVAVNTTGNILWRLGADSASEMTEEGVQSMNASMENDGMAQYNTPLSQRLMDDVLHAGQAWASWANQFVDLGLLPDGDVISSMNATPLLTLFGPGSAQVAVLVRNGMREYNTIDVVKHNIDAQRRGEVAMLEQGERYASYSSKDQRKKMLLHFDTFKRFASAYDDAAKRVASKDGEYMLEEDERRIPEQVIDAQIAEYENIYNLANSTEAKAIATRGGIKPGSSKFNKMVSLLNYRSNRVADALEHVEEVEQLILSEFGGISMLPNIDTDKEISTEDASGYVDTSQENIAKALIYHHTLAQIYEDYTTASKATNKSAKEFLLDISNKKQAVEKYLKSVGIETKTAQQTKEVANLTSYGMFLMRMVNNTLPEESKVKTVNEALSPLGNAIRQHTLAVADVNAAYTALKYFQQNPGKDIAKWEKRQQRDEELLRTLQEDYINSREEEIEARVNQTASNKPYIGNDGRWYIAKYHLNLEDGSIKLKKHLYHPLTGTWNEEQLPFYGKEFREGRQKEAEQEVQRQIKRRQIVGEEQEQTESAIKDNSENNLTSTDISLEPVVESTETDETHKEISQEEKDVNDALDQADMESDMQDEEDQRSGTNSRTSSFRRVFKALRDSFRKLFHKRKQDDEKLFDPEMSDDLFQESDEYTKERKSRLIALAELAKNLENDPTDAISTENAISFINALFEFDNWRSEQSVYVPFDKQPSLDETEQDIVETVEYWKERLINSGFSWNSLVPGETDKTLIFNTNVTIQTVFEKPVTQNSPSEEVDTVHAPLITHNGVVIQKGVIDIVNYVKKEADAKSTEPVVPNQTLRAVMERLNQKKSTDESRLFDKNDNKRQTGADYFIKIGNKILKFLRVHSFLEGQYAESKEERQKRRTIFNRLSTLTKDNFGAFVYNSDENIMPKIVTTGIITKLLYLLHRDELREYAAPRAAFDIKEYASSVSHILARKIADVAVQPGNIVDEIGRIFFQDREHLENKPEYKMSDKVFLAIVSQFDELQQELNARGWVVDTHPYTWYVQDQDGTNIAGETDMIAIDLEGKIHILDFKTTRTDKFEKGAKKSENGLIDFDAEPTIEGSSFVQVISGFRTTASQYMRQLTVYRQMINTFFGEEVVGDSIIIPFLLQYDSAGDELVQITGSKRYDLINLSAINQLKPDKKFAEELMKDGSKVISLEIVDSMSQDIEDAVSESEEYVENQALGSDRKNKITDLVRLLSEADSVLLNTSRERVDYIRDQIIKIKDVIRELNEQIAEAKKDLIEQQEEEARKLAARLKEEEEARLAAQRGKDGWRLRGEREPISEEEEQHWFSYNNLRYLFARAADAPRWAKNWIKCLLNRDLLGQNGAVMIFEETKNSTKDEPKFQVTVNYNGKKYGPIFVKLGQIGGEVDNSKLNPGMDMLSAMARNLIVQYDDLKTQLKPGEKIIVTRAKRTNGKLKYLDDGKTQMLSTTRLSGRSILHDSDYEKLINREDPTQSLVGFVDEAGNVTDFADNTRPIIYSPNKDSHGTVVGTVPGHKHEGLAPGTVVFLYKFRNEEDSIDEEPRTIPITLRGRKLTEGDIDFVTEAIIRILNGEDHDASIPLTGIMKDGSRKEMHVPGFTWHKALNMITRFGKQGEKAGHEFRLYIDNDNNVRVTDLRQDPVRQEDSEGNEIFARPLSAPIDPRTTEGRLTLKEILLLADLLINQKGIASAEMRTSTENGKFGNLHDAFANDEDLMSLTFGDVTIDADDVLGKDESATGLPVTGIGWAIKHGYARTNVLDIEDPLLSIHELGIAGRQAQKPAEPEEGDAKPTGNDLGGQLPIVGPSTDATEGETPQQKGPKQPKDLSGPQNKGNAPSGTSVATMSVLEFSDYLDQLNDEGKELSEEEKAIIKKDPAKKKAYIDFCMSLQDEDEGVEHMQSTQLRPKMMNYDERMSVEKRLKRLVGKVAVEWYDTVILLLKSGPVVGKAVVSAIKLSKLAPDGTEYHEAFHRMLELLTPTSIRNVVYKAYRKENGKDLSDKLVSEGLAEDFRLWQNNRTEIHLHGNILKTFKEIRSFVKELSRFDSKTLATYMVIANSGIFRYIKPSRSNIERFNTIFKGESDMVLRERMSKGVVKSVTLKTISDYGHLQLIDEALEGIMYALVQTFSLDMLGSNAGRIKTDRASIRTLFKKKSDLNEDSSWFRVITGSYAENEDEPFDASDAMAYIEMYGHTEEVQLLMEQAKEKASEKMDELTPKEFGDEIQKTLISLVIAQESERTKEDLNYNQKVMNELLCTEAYEIVERKLNRKLSKISIDSERKRHEDKADRDDTATGEEEGDDEGNTISSDIQGHDDAFFEHSRTDDASAAVRFFLSTICDEQFELDEDGNYVRGKDGFIKTIPNRTNTFGFRQHLPMKTVSNLILLTCHKCRNAGELLRMLEMHKEDNPIFQRVYKAYNAAMLKEVKRHNGVLEVNGEYLINNIDYRKRKDKKTGKPYYVRVKDGKPTGERIENATQADSKIRITVNGKEVPYGDYLEQRGADGKVFFEDAKTGEVMVDAEVMVDRDYESFVTQFFNYVSCQRISLNTVKIQHEQDEYGIAKPDGKITMRVQSTNSDYDSTIYPKHWFELFRSGVSGLFKIVTREGEQRYVMRDEMVDEFKRIMHRFDMLAGKINIMSLSQSEFNKHFVQFIEDINTLGITIDRQLLEWILRNKFGKPTIKENFASLIRTAEQDLSFKRFVNTMYKTFFHRPKTRNGSVVSTVIKDVTPIIATDRRSTKLDGKEVPPAGSFIYAESSFVKFLASGIGEYNKQTRDLMTPAAGNTMAYTMAQSHTASDITDELNAAETYLATEEVDGQVVPVNKIKTKGLAKDMSNFMYCVGKRVLDSRGVKNIRYYGSIILKNILNKTGMLLKLQTHGGVKNDLNHDTGTQYKKLTQREDLLAKITILAQGGLISPTLSDKSNYFYLTGANIPGLDYRNMDNVVGRSLPKLAMMGDMMFVAFGENVEFNEPNPQLDQMLEYALTERDMVEDMIARQKAGKKYDIESFGGNCMRFGHLSEIVVPVQQKDGSYVAQLIVLNDYDKTPEECLRLADQHLFSKSPAEQRQIMAMTLLHGFEQYIDFAIQNGLIEIDDSNELATEKGMPHKFLRLANVGLDSDIISKLRDKYDKMLPKKQLEVAAVRERNAESRAIVAFMWDTYLRGQISHQEMERTYIGALQFYKWKHDTVEIKNPDGTTQKVNVLTDNASDLAKRLGGLGSTGDKNRLDFVDGEEDYVCAEVEDQMVVSKMHSEIEKTFVSDALREQWFDIASTGMSEEEKDELADKLFLHGSDKYLSTGEVEALYDANADYKAVKAATVARAKKKASVFTYNNKGEADINVADGAAYITPKMAKTLLRQRGRLTSSVAEAFDYLEGKKKGNVLKNREAYKIIQEALLGAWKYSAYGHRVDESTDEIPVHYYNKFALFPIFPQMASGFTADVLKKMDEQGIDMLMMHSAVKTGSQSPSEFSPTTFETADQLKAFEFKTYKQPYKFIRRQLNTDPHEKETTTMGTQMTKVALSSLDMNTLYETDEIGPDGKRKTIRGRDLVHKIFHSINSLAKLGAENIEGEFFDDNGDLDVDKMSRFLEEELMQRDADENLLDGIEVIEIDGKKQFKIPLECMSSVDWILSIIVSKINREICDINVKGNAFYQRSVWGMEGNPILSDEEMRSAGYLINGGKDLQMVNEDGSMDAVISMDYFNDIIPEGLKDNFEAARRWLIDNKVIGPQAVANTIASRIPTQAQSSIHALRFVDVLPVVRDTIVLPKEFTKITGSDFDIDKLYLARMSFNVKREKVGEKAVSTVSTTFDENTNATDYHRNALLTGYMTILKSHGRQLEDGTIEGSRNSEALLGSIDDDTQLAKNALARIEAGQKKTRAYAYMVGNIAYQVERKADFMAGKFGIAPFALNNNNQVLTLLSGVKFAKSEGHVNMMEALGCLDLSIKKEKDGYVIEDGKKVPRKRARVLQWLSGLINAHVDVAKDPWIIRLNVNDYTWNLTNLLTRTGMGEGTFMFLGQPIMKEAARRYMDEGGTLFVDPGLSKSTRQKRALINMMHELFDNIYGEPNSGRMLINEYMESGRKNENSKSHELIEEELGQLAKQLFGIDEDGNLTDNAYTVSDGLGGYADVSNEHYTGNRCHTILEDVITNPDARIDKNKPATIDNLKGPNDDYKYVVTLNGQEVEMSPKEILMYTFFINNQLLKYTEAMSGLVNACKIDTKKQGKSFVEQRAYMEQYDRVFDNEDGIFEQDGLDKLKGEDLYEDYSYIHTKTSLAIGLYRRVLQGISLQASDEFVELHGKIMTLLNSSERNKKLSAKVTKAIMSHIKLNFFRDFVSEQNEDYYNDLFYGPNCVQYRVTKLLNKIQKDKSGKYSKFGKNGVITNPLLAALSPDVYEEKKHNRNPKLLVVKDALLNDSDNANDLFRAWDELYNSDIYEEVDGEKVYWVKLLAIDLAVHAMFTSGDTRGRDKFFNYVPNTVRLAIVVNGETYPEYMQRMMDNPHLISEIDPGDVIAENWMDNDFVKDFRPIRYRKGIGRQNLIKAISSMRFVRLTLKKNKKGKYYYKSTWTEVDTAIAAFGTANNKIWPTITRGVNGEFPLYIKIRRKNSEKTDPDAYLLYKFESVGNEGENEYPIYTLVNPQSASITAGSFFHTIYEPHDGKTSVAYPQEMEELQRKIQNGTLFEFSEMKKKAFLESDGLVYQELLTEFLKKIADALAKNTIIFRSMEEDGDLELFIMAEYENAGMHIEQSPEFQQLMSYFKKLLKAAYKKPKTEEEDESASDTKKKNNKTDESEQATGSEPEGLEDALNSLELEGLGKNEKPTVENGEIDDNAETACKVKKGSLDDALNDLDLGDFKI